jgi:type II secretory pathway pseudopilin PulG
MKWPQDPRHKNILITILVFLVLLLLSALVVVSTIKLASVEAKLNTQLALMSDYESKLEEYATKATVIPINGEDGRDGEDGTDGKDGVDGTNAMSTHTETTVIKEVAVPAKDGVNGQDAANLIPVMDFATCILGFMREGDDFPRNLVKIPNCEAL